MERLAPIGNSIQMEIGGVNFSISVSSKTPYILQEHDSIYQPFLKKTKANKSENKTGEAIDINIHLQLGNLPDTGKMTKIFDSGQSWSMFLEGDIYWLVLHPPVHKEPFWAARFTRDIEEITVYCGQKLTSEKNGKIVIANPVRHPLDQLLFMYILARGSGALIHCAGIEINGKGFLFAGPSGAGKSTLSRLFQKQKRPGVLVLSDERIIVRKTGKTFNAFGTPWSGEAGIAENKTMPLSGIFFLNHGTADKIKEIKPRQAMETLLKVVSIPWYDRDVMPEVLAFCQDLVATVPAFELHFTPGPDVLKLLEKFASGG